jgi:hypothetical protein
MNFTDITSLLNFLVYGGGVILVASWALDKIQAFVALPSETKKFINIILSVVLALGAYAALLYVPAGIFALIDPWFKVALSVVVLYSGQQVVHQLTK